MEPDYKPKQASGRPIALTTWLKLFLGISFIALLGFLTWKKINDPMQNADGLREIQEHSAEYMLKILAKNPPPKNYSGTLTEEITYLVDATDQGQWVHYSFSNGTLLKNTDIIKDSLDWDIAFRRAKIITNGGATNKKSKGAIAKLETTDFGSVDKVPANAQFHEDQLDRNPLEPNNPVTDKWYQYDFWAHKLIPMQSVYLIRTAKGRYVKLQILDYYCGTVTGCYTLRYVYQGNDSTSFVKQ